MIDTSGGDEGAGDESGPVDDNAESADGGSEADVADGAAAEGGAEAPVDDSGSVADDGSAESPPADGGSRRRNLDHPNNEGTRFKQVILTDSAEGFEDEITFMMNVTTWAVLTDDHELQLHGQIDIRNDFPTELYSGAVCFGLRDYADSFDCV